MIKQVKNWIKDKWIRFKKLIIAVFGISAVLAAPMAIPESNTVIIYKDVKELSQQEQRIKYIAPARNFENIQHAELRQQIDWQYNEAHDALSAAYYEEYEFVWNGNNYGILEKETFDKLQAMLWSRYEVLFDSENKKQPQASQIDESEYNELTDIDGNVIGKKSDKAKLKIQEFKNQGIDINL